VLLLAVGVGGACTTPEDAAVSTSAGILADTSDGGTSDLGRTSHFAEDAAASSTREILAEALAARPGPAAMALRAANESTLRRFGAAVHAAATVTRARAGLADEPEIVHDEHAIAGRRTVAPDGDQSAALTRLNAVAAGTLRAQWDDSFGGPSALERLWFVRRGVPERTVVEAFLDAHIEDLRALWKVSARSELVVSSVRPLDGESSVVDLERRVGGVPVQGEWFEALVTHRESRFGSGVLTRFGGSARARPALPHATPRDRWLTAEGARHAAGVTGAALGQRLVYLRGATLQPAWIVQERSGRERTIDAITGALLAERDARGFLGPTTIQGWPPGATSVQSIVLRGANVTDTTGQSVGEMHWKDGAHGFTSPTLRVQLAGPVGLTNSAAIGRVFRTDGRDGSVGDPLPFARDWNAQYQHQATFGDPDRWEPNTGSIPFPHTTELVYGWLSYWQYFVGQKVGLQVADRLGFEVNPWVVGNVNIATGFFAGRGIAVDLLQADENGAMTSGIVYVNVGLNDDVRPGEFATGGTGDEIFSVGHEFGHTITTCAAAPGASCNDTPPAYMTADMRTGYMDADWRPAVWDGHSEMNPTLLSNVLTQFRYRNFRDGVPYDAAWNYISYDDPNDSFGSPTQSDSGTSNCLATGSSCATGFVCVPAFMHRASVPYADPPATPTAGWCEPVYQTWTDALGTPTNLADDVPSALSACPSAMFAMPRGYNGSNPMFGACWHSQYFNKFFDTVGSRLVTMVGWRPGLLTAFNAVSGQSGNPKRDLVLGTDSYYARYTMGATHRYEAMRAVRSVYRGTGFVANDDFPGVLPSAPVLPIRGSDWVKVWWGNGQWAYPNSEDTLDVDAIIVRGVAGLRFEIETSVQTATTAPAIDLWRVDGTEPEFVQTSLTGSLQTAALPATAWYMVAFVPQSVGAWEARMRYMAGSDDLSGDAEEAWPLVHGVVLDAQATSSDADAFSFDVPSSAVGSNLTLNVDAPFASSVAVSQRVGSTWSSVGTWSLASGTTSVTVPVGTSTSRFAFALTASGNGPYTVQANLACASGTTPCDVSEAPVRGAVAAWGDRFAGRLDGTTSVHEFTIDLAERDNVSVSVTDNDTTCRPRIEILPPPIQRYFLDASGNQQAALVWDDGAPVNHVSADTVGAGGHFEAATAGAYRIRVRPQPMMSCPWYRLHVARTYASPYPRPSW